MYDITSSKEVHAMTEYILLGVMIGVVGCTVGMLIAYKSVERMLEKRLFDELTDKTLLDRINKGEKNDK